MFDGAAPAVPSILYLNVNLKISLTSIADRGPVHFRPPDIPYHVCIGFETIFWVKILKFLADPGSGNLFVLRSGIRDGKNSDMGSAKLGLTRVKWYFVVCRRGHGRDGVHRGGEQHERPRLRVPAVPGTK
jgi:hypothetical protein